MEFAEPGGPVTLLHFTPLLNDDYNYGRCYENSTASGCSQGTPQPVEAAMPAHAMDAPMNCSLPYSYVGSINNCEVYNSLSMEQTPGPAAYCASQQEQMQTTQHRPATMEEYGAGFGVLLPDADISDISVRPPMCLPRLDPPAAVSVDTTMNANDSSYHSLSPASSSSFYGESHSLSSPHSPMSMIVSDQSHRKNFCGISKTYPKRSKPSTRDRRMTLRANSPMFPDQSTPLSSLKRQSSVSSITSNRSADQASTFSFPQSTNSDPSIYSIPNACDSSLNSPSVNSVGQFSPRFEYSSQSSASSVTSASMEGSSRSCLELEIPAKYARRISELDRKILKLQGERSKVLEKVHLTKSASSGLIADTRISDMDMWLFSEKLPEMGKAHLYIIPLGIHELDDPLYDDANKLLREVGGMYLDLQTSITLLRDVCCKGVFIPADISTCFAYIKSLLHKNTCRNLKLSNLEGVYSIQLDADETPLERVLPAEFTESLEAANKVLRCAQRITLSYMSMQMELLKLRQIAAGKLDTCNAIFNKLELVGERRSQIRAVLEGNCTTMASAERVWPQYYQAATQAIKIITECVHPSSSS